MSDKITEKTEEQVTPIALRESLIGPAVKFLIDPKVVDAPMAKKVAFLESKGLTQNEIQESIKRASGGSNQTIVSNPNMINQPQPPPFTPQGYLPVQQYSQSNYWKDILLGIMLTGSAGYGLFYLLKDYWGSFFPTDDSWKQDKKELSENIKQTQDILEKVSSETTNSVQLLKTQDSDIQGTLKSVTELVRKLTEAEEKREIEMKLLKEDLIAVKNMVPMLMDKAKEMQSCTVSDIQSEIKSLKAIISNNRRVVSHSITDTSLPSGKATLPEWQLDTSVGKNTLIETKEE